MEDTTPKTRTAILLDENGVEIYRGHPGDMPIRFCHNDDTETVVCEATMNGVLYSGVPIDADDGSDLEIHEAG